MHNFLGYQFLVVAWSSWSTCGTSCRINRTRTCNGSSACEEFETDECQDGNCDPSEYKMFTHQNMNFNISAAPEFI